MIELKKKDATILLVIAIAFLTLTGIIELFRNEFKGAIFTFLMLIIGGIGGARYISKLKS